MAKQLLKERFQQLAGLKPLYTLNEYTTTTYVVIYRRKDDPETLANPTLIPIKDLEFTPPYSWENKELSYGWKLDNYYNQKSQANQRASQGEAKEGDEYEYYVMTVTGTGSM